MYFQLFAVIHSVKYLKHLLFPRTTISVCIYTVLLVKEAFNLINQEMICSHLTLFNSWLHVAHRNILEVSFFLFLYSQTLSTVPNLLPKLHQITCLSSKDKFIKPAAVRENTITQKWLRRFRSGADFHRFLDPPAWFKVSLSVWGLLHLGLGYTHDAIF